LWQRQHDGVVVSNLICCVFFLLDVDCCLPGFGFGSHVCLFVVFASCLLSNDGCRVLTVDCRVSLSVAVVDSWFSGAVVGGWLLIVGVDCRSLFLPYLVGYPCQACGAIIILRTGEWRKGK
jgi:hypothetical protein